jgi:TPM domain
MIGKRWLVAIPVVLATAILTPTLEAADIRDRAKMFDPDVVKKADARLNRREKTSGIPIVIETIEEIPGVERDAEKAVKRKAIAKLAVERDEAIKDEGIYVLISKRDHVISPVLVRERLARVMPIEKRQAVIDAFTEHFKKDDYDGGLKSAVETLERSLEGVSAGKAGHRAPGAAPVAVHDLAQRQKPKAGGSAMGTFLLIILGIFGVLLFLRLLGGLFNRGAGAGYRGQMGGYPRPGMGPGGPGYYGGPGGGGGGGGFFSGLMGGLGGALAGNWLYDQFSGGRHGHTTPADTGYAPNDVGAGTDQGGDAIVGADDNPGGGTSWDDPGAGADPGGGGDWGGGGGDWGGGGGGDWGGGGGDFGGGGGGGGDW